MYICRERKEREDKIFLNVLFKIKFFKMLVEINLVVIFRKWIINFERNKKKI